MESRHSRRDRGIDPGNPWIKGIIANLRLNRIVKKGADPNAQVATTIQRMIDLVAQIVDRQGQNPVIQSENTGNHVERKDRVLEWFQKFSLPKFLGGPNPDVAKRSLEKMIDIFAALHYTEDRQGDFRCFSIRGSSPFLVECDTNEIGKRTNPKDLGKFHEGV